MLVFAIIRRWRVNPADQSARATDNNIDPATPDRNDVAWDDLMLPNKQIGQLRALATHRDSFEQVTDQPGNGLAGHNPHNVTALFVGASGTGRTLAAEIVAHEQDLSLCHVDLSRVVNTYNGETEKTLAAIFKEAEQSGTILLLEEADALFGKHTPVRDARDRYASLVGNYLLQKIESFDGMVLLTTNSRDNMDSAFLRRIRVVVDFPMPDAAQRARIWERSFPSTCQLASDVHLNRIAEEFDLTGDRIRKIALRAAYLAGVRGQAIDMACLLDALRIEGSKIGSEAAPGSLARGVPISGTAWHRPAPTRADWGF